MKIIWVVNIPIGALAKRFGTSADSGSWLSVVLDSVKNIENEYYIVTTCSIKEKITVEEDNITYIALPLGIPADYRHTEKKLAVWKKLFAEISPDVVQIWGTEYQHALSAAIASHEKCKSLVYVQGVMDSVYENYFGGMSRCELLRYTSPIEIMMGKSVFTARKRIKRCAQNEQKIIEMIDGIITETEWSKAHYRFTADCKNFYFDILPINRVFVESKRKEEKIIPHTVFAPASNYPLKGGHNLIKAIALVKKDYPDVKLVMPGFKLTKDLSLKQKLKDKCYRRYLRALITKLDLWDNVEFVGVLSQAEMANQMEKAEVFVCSSKIENHSSTLREAMFVGMPCISSCVGGIPEYLKNGENGEFYAFEDYIELAGKITKLFGDKEYAKMLSENARKKMIDYYKNNTSDFSQIYTTR